MMIRLIVPICMLGVGAVLSQPTSRADAGHAISSAANQQSSDKFAIHNPHSAMKVLFDGKSLDGWRGYKSDAVPQGWRIEGGVLTKDGPVADIMTKDQFGDFELELEWKIGEAGNSGILYRGTEEYDHIYWSAPEYQLLDDTKATDNKTRLTCAGAAYALYPSPAGHLKPVGEFNATKIVARGAHVEHWLNNMKLLEYELWSPDWEAKVKASKFAAYPNYGRAKRGHIALQGDHAGVLAFRNIRIRELK
jgi:hypothetical protein